MALRLALFASLALAVSGCNSCRGDTPSGATAASAQPSAAPRALSSAQKCDEAKAALDAFIAELPVTCQKSEDCGGYFLHANTCGGVSVVTAPGCPPPKKPRLFALQNEVQKNCPEGPACDPAPYVAECVAGKCVNTLKK